MGTTYLFKKIKKMSLAALLLLAGFFNVSCLDEIAPGNYYTFTGETVAGFLDNKNQDFSSFIYVLKKAELWSSLSTYGTYTCLAPTNSAFEQFLQEKGIPSVSDLTIAECDTIARTHIIEYTFYCTELVEGSIPYPNMLDRYLTYSADSDTINNNKTIIFRINKKSQIIERDDTVQNGVVHIVDMVIQPSSDFLPDVIKADTTVSLFYTALVETRLSDSLINFIDERYKEPGGDSTTIGVKYKTGLETERGIYPAKRYFKFTAFVEKNEVFRAKGIYTLDDLKAYAKSVYDASYPEHAGKFDNDPTDRRNPLNRFISYHLLESYCGYNDFNVTNSNILANFVKRDYQDVEDYFETMMPNSIMRICTPNKPNNVYLNRKGYSNKVVTVPGIRVKAPSETDVEQTALNGLYHYIDDILVYSKNVRENVLNIRMRIDATTLSPDFINSGGRNRLLNSNDRVSTGMKRGFVKNVSFSQETIVYVRYRDPTFSCYCGDEVAMKGIYDITFKIPPVPTSGTYEVRLGYFAMPSRGVIQIYFNGDPCGIPLDLRIEGSDHRIGWVTDSELGSEESIKAADKSMRNRGYMKGMDIYANNNTDNTFRNQVGSLRRILTTEYMYADRDNFIRIRQVLDDVTAEFPFDYIEVVPKSAYSGEIPEDMH